MGFINKNTNALLNTILTDTARRRISQGNFNIKYFQLGDSEVDYTHNDITELKILKPKFNQSNSTGLPEKNLMSIKHPLILDDNNDNTYAIPFMDSFYDEIYNKANPLGFFNLDNTLNVNDKLELNPNFVIDSYNSNEISLERNNINIESNSEIEDDSFMVVFFSDFDVDNLDISNIRIYKVLSSVGNATTDNNISVTIDRDLKINNNLSVRVVFYPKSFIPFYDSQTPEDFWDESNFNFSSICESNDNQVKILNLTNVWSKDPAGTFLNIYKTFEDFKSFNFIGTKNYLGYSNDDGHTDSMTPYFYNSYGEKIIVNPSEQKNISIIHYSNNDITNYYGEKFALKPFNDESTGSDKNFKLNIPTLLWHKNKNNPLNNGETFYVNPPIKSGLNTVQVISSNSNEDMNEPGMRYFNLWDNHLNIDGYPSRVGKVFPDLKLIVIDDQEIAATLNGISDRNFTLPTPKLSLIPTSFNPNNEIEGILNNDDETLWITYTFDGMDNTFLHCNNYMNIKGNNVNCPPFENNVLIRFGDEFPFQNTVYSPTELKIIVQKTQNNEQPKADEWKEINVTNQLNGSTTPISNTTLTNSQIIITKDLYDNADFYDLSEYIHISEKNEERYTFGDEYFFYGTLETDIQATIYVMDFKCNISENQFLVSKNPTWGGGDTYFSEVGLYNSDKELMLISKLQSPQKRVGVQQISLKLDI